MTGGELSYYDLQMLAMRADENAMIAGGMFITIVTGFLVMSHVVGASLSRKQCLFVTPLFLAFSFITLLQTVGYSVASDRYRPHNWSPDLPPFAIVDLQAPFSPSNITMAAGALVVIGCLYFLYDVRRKARLESRTEEADSADAVDAHEPDAETPAVEALEEVTQPADTKSDAEIDDAAEQETKA